MDKKIRAAGRRLFSFNIWKYLLINLIATFFLNCFLELMARKSLASLLLFMNERTFLFLFNGFLIFTTLSAVLLFRKKIFAFALCSGTWLVIGLVNGVILKNRKTPFTAVDLTIAKSILPILRSYLSLPEIIGAVLLVVAATTGLVCLFLYTREQRRDYDGKAALFWVFVICAVFVLFLKVGTAKGILARKFDNLIAAYQDYGVAYCFFITAVDTGIDRPLNYSETSVKKIQKRVNKKMKEKEEGAGRQKRKPNIIFVQLESFFDPVTVKQLKISEDPIPNFRRIEEEYTSGRLHVPVYGAGTINTEFEVLTGMSLDYFGSGEYPYRSILHKKTCDNISYWLEEEGYATTVVHNNNASFYDRDKVFCNLGIENFISIENMNVTERNETGWAKDYILKDHILDVLKTTEEPDLVYAISVQGHGDYPVKEAETERRIRVDSSSIDEKTLNAWEYYVNEIYEMDDFIGQLLNALEDYPEDVMVIAYGDHLPGMNLESSDLTAGSKYDTPYFIWDNFDYNKKNRDAESENVEAWQLASKVLSQVSIDQGTLNRYHQTMQGTRKYKKNLRLLEYDMLYGSNFVRRNEPALEASQIRYGIHDPVIDNIYPEEEEGAYIISGSHFTDQSRVFVNGIKIHSEKLSDTRIRISRKAVKNKDEIRVCQVSQSNEKIMYNGSEAWIFEEFSVDSMKKP